jgi:uncharacterized protein (TIGR04255 family)
MIATMAFEHPNYEKPPAIEAMIEVVFADPLDQNTVRRAVEALPRDQYPSRQNEAGFEVKIQVTGPTVDKTGDRTVLRDAGALQTVIIQKSSLVFSRQAPYPGWEAFFDAAWSVYTKTRAKIGYRKIVRLGLRYVNRLDLPNDESGAAAQYEEYLHTGYKDLVMEGVGRPRAFATQTDYINVRGADLAIVRVGTMEPAIIGHSSILLDIDVQSLDVPQSEVDLQNLIHRLRESKNAIFLACVTPKAEALFKPVP